MTNLLAGLVFFLIVGFMFFEKEIEEQVLDHTKEVCAEGTITVHVGFFIDTYECQLKEEGGDETNS